MNESETTDTNEEQAEETEAAPAEEAKPEPKKPEETPEAKRARLKRQLEQLDKKHGFKDDDKPANKSGDTDYELDWGQKAFLRSYDIKGSDELALVKNWIKRTGDNLDAVVEDDIFQGKLKNLREARASADAIPKGTKRSGQQTADSVEYWIAKGELPPDTPENQQLRTDVVNAKLKAKTAGSVFSSNPVIGK